MNRFFTLLFAASCLTAVGQVTYPYNPDEDGNGQIAVGDLQGILATYGNAFSPSEILVDGETLTTVLTQLQNSIDSLSGLTGGGGSVLDMPLGTVLPIATESVPEGWMLCDGREISIEEYQGLYDLIGTTYGSGDSAFWAQVFYPATTFNIPDLRGRTIIGANDMGGEQSDVLAIHSASVGEVGGEEMHQLTEAEMPSHSHQVEIEGWDFVYSQGGYDGFSGPQEFPTTSQEETSFEGGDQPHNNMQPYMALNYMMKVQTAEFDLTYIEESIEELNQWRQSHELEAGIIGSQVDYPYDGTNPINGYFVPDSVDLLMPQPSGWNVNRYVMSKERKPLTVIGLQSFGVLNDTLMYFELSTSPYQDWNPNNPEAKLFTLVPLFNSWFVK